MKPSGTVGVQAVTILRFQKVRPRISAICVGEPWPSLSSRGYLSGLIQKDIAGLNVTQVGSAARRGEDESPGCQDDHLFCRSSGLPVRCLLNSGLSLIIRWRRLLARFTDLSVGMTTRTGPGSWQMT